MKKNIKFLFALLLTGTLCSCGDWLKIDPQYEITDRDLYKNTAGYYKCINGLYLQMSDLSLYGKELSWGAADVMARYYKIDENSDTKAYPHYYRLEFNDSDAASMTAAIWSRAYKLIAQANDLIANAEKTQADFFDKMELDRNTILGEAYAIRAMMHFDLLRLFGASMAVDPDGRYIPYVEIYPSTVNPPITNRSFIQKVIADLTRAKELLVTLDVETNPSRVTADSERLFGSTTPSQGKFYGNRGLRLNYYAVTILLARASLWAEQPNDALIQAQEIIDLVTDKKLAFQSSGTLSSTPKSFKDLLFGFYHEKLVETFEPYANRENSRRLTIDQPSFFTTPTSDKRVNFLESTRTYLQRYTVAVTPTKDMVIPAIRISEAYYIAAECRHKTDMATAAANLMVVRKARGYSSPALKPSMSEGEFWTALTYEYRKEFIGEGQLLFFFKRTNRPIDFSEGSFNHNGKLVLPVPDSESAI